MQLYKKSNLKYLFREMPIYANNRRYRQKGQEIEAGEYTTRGASVTFEDAEPIPLLRGFFLTNERVVGYLTGIRDANMDDGIEFLYNAYLPEVDDLLVGAAETYSTQINGLDCNLEYWQERGYETGAIHGGLLSARFSGEFVNTLVRNFVFPNLLHGLMEFPPGGVEFRM